LKELIIDDNAPISTASWLNSDSDPQIYIYSVDKDRKLIAKVYDIDREDWADCRVTPDELVRKDSSIAAVSSSDGSISVFYQPAENGKIIAQYSEKENRRVSLGIPTTFGSSLVQVSGAEVTRLTQENGRLNDEKNRLHDEIKRLRVNKDLMFRSGMLGQTTVERVCALTEAQRQTLSRRLREVVDRFHSDSNLWNSPQFKSDVEILSAEFQLGVVWQGASEIWDSFNAQTAGAVIYDPTQPLQQRLRASLSFIALQGNGFGLVDHMNKYFFVDTLYQLCRYLGVE